MVQPSDDRIAPSPIDRRRRRLLQIALAAPVLLLPGGPARAAVLDVTRLHPVRFLGGLILDVATAVLVEVAKDYVLGRLRDGQVSLAAAVPVNEGGGSRTSGAFNHVGYKVSLVRLGVVDYREYQRRVLALALKQAADGGRFAALRDYLIDERIRVKLADADYSQRVAQDLEPDDLFTLDYLDVPEQRLPIHYRNLIDASGARVFDRWYG